MTAEEAAGRQEDPEQRRTTAVVVKMHGGKTFSVKVDLHHDHVDDLMLIIQKQEGHPYETQRLVAIGMELPSRERLGSLPSRLWEAGGPLYLVTRY